MFTVKTIQWKYSKQSCQRHASNRQSWLSNHNSEQVLAKMSPEEHLKISLIMSSFFFNFSVFFLYIYFSVKSKKANLIRLILFQNCQQNIPQKSNTLLFSLSFDEPVAYLHVARRFTEVIIQTCPYYSMHYSQLLELISIPRGAFRNQL